MLAVFDVASEALLALASMILVLIFITILHRHPALYTAVMGLGALAWLVGSLLVGTFLTPTPAPATTLYFLGPTGLFQTASDAEGNYLVTLLPPGMYTLTVDASGFAKVKATNVLPSEPPAPEWQTPLNGEHCIQSNEIVFRHYFLNRRTY